jgi:TusA-related sulfurtransferase
MPDIVPNEVLDVKGEICPYPDIKTRKKLKQMKPGQILAVLTDYPLSVERIPRNVEKEGNKVLKVERIEGPTYRILIQAGSSG